MSDQVVKHEEGSFSLLLHRQKERMGICRNSNAMSVDSLDDFICFLYQSFNPIA